MLKNHKTAVALSLSFAFATEFLQLFLGRDGRLYDLGIDTFGILSAYLCMMVLNAVKRVLL
ncbi:VanZ family protein [Bacillota bacterium Lsc_1132]